MRILVLNSGSSSLKFQLFSFEDGKGEPEHKILAKGIYERIGSDKSRLKYANLLKDREEEIDRPVSDHREALKSVLSLLVDENLGVLSSLDEIDAVGHRVVHGGEEFSGSVIIDERVKEVIKKNFELAPLHNPPNFAGIEACEELLKDIPQVAVFDTAFHQTLEPSAFLYALPYDFYKKHRIRRYGFHGTSHRYVTMETLRYLEKNFSVKPEESRIITAHLGNGASMSAVLGGKSVDTTMGFTPLEGLVMGTRSGDIDPALVIYLIRDLGMSPDDVDVLLNKKSGLLGLSGVSNDMRDLLEAEKNGNQLAHYAIEVFVRRIKKYIGAYVAVLGGLDALVFTAGIGEYSPEVRERVVEGLEVFGLTFDREKNKRVSGEFADLSVNSGLPRVLVVPTNEELMIALDTYRLVLR